MLPGFASHRIAPFSEEKIRQFVQAWYVAQDDLDAASPLTQSLAVPRGNQNDLIEKPRHEGRIPQTENSAGDSHDHEIDEPRDNAYPKAGVSHATFGGFGEYDVRLEGQRDGDKVVFDGAVDLGETSGGVFDWTGGKPS